MDFPPESELSQLRDREDFGIFHPLIHSIVAGKFEFLPNSYWLFDIIGFMLILTFSCDPEGKCGENVEEQNELTSVSSPNT